MKENQGFVDYFKLDTNKSYRIVELGAGTGIIGIGIGKKLKQAEIVISDYSEECLKLIDMNIK